MNVPLLDLKQQYAALKAEIDRAVMDVFESQYFILGDRVEACEQAVAEYCRAEYGIGVSSGTDALLIAMMAEGIGAGDEVITTPYSFFATAGSIVRLGARPVFVDIDPLTFNLNAAALADAVTERTRAILPVHLFGQLADMEPIMEMAAQHDLVVIEDACQAIGAEQGGQRAGSIGHYGCFSFFPSKNLGGAGDGGMVTVREKDRYALLRRLRNHGMEPKYHHHLVGGNFRLDALQAAVVSVKLNYLDDWTERRRANAARYRRLFEVAGVREIELPQDITDRHVYNQFVIRAPRRDNLRAFLQERNIGTEIYYPAPLHRQPCFADLGYSEGSLPESERAAAETLALPVFPELSDDQAAWVVESIRAFYKGGGH